MYIFFVEFERISHNSFTIIYYVFKEIPVYFNVANFNLEQNPQFV